MKVYYCFPGGKYKVFTMSYDDGRGHDIRMIEIMNRYGIKGTFHLNSGNISSSGEAYVPSDRITALYEGHEIASHTMDHPTPDRCPAPYFAQQILEDRKGLEALAGYPVRGFAYPNSRTFSDFPEIAATLPALGIAYARMGAFDSSFQLPDNPYAWKATCSHKDPRLMEYGRSFCDFNVKAYTRLMCVRGHSYEFDRDDNWDVLEELCSLVGGRDDIWYATMIQIVDYMQVIKNLQFTADFNMVYNPSAASAWLEVNDERIVEVKGGEYTNLRNFTQLI